jgi:hypothetical protein
MDNAIILLSHRAGYKHASFVKDIDDNRIMYCAVLSLLPKALTRHALELSFVLSYFILVVAKLIVESDNFGRVKIKGATTRYYLCFKKDGRLIGRKVTLISYFFFIIICPECLTSAVYIALMGRIRHVMPTILLPPTRI